MPTVRLNNAAMQAIRSAAEFPLKQTGLRTGPDEWTVPLQQETLDRIEQASLKGESLSDAILRVVSLSRSGGRSQ